MEPSTPPSLNPFSAPVAVDVPVASYSYKPLGKLAGALVVMLALLAIIDVINTVVTISAPEMVGALARGSEEPAEGAELFIGAVSALVLLRVALYLALAIGFPVLVARANRNARGFGAGAHLNATPGWAAVYFYLPIVNLWKPYYAVKEIWQASDSSADPRLLPQSRPVPGILPLWWWAFILMGGFERSAGKVVELTVEKLSPLGLTLVVVSTLLTIAAALLAMTVIRRLATMQAARRRAADGEA